MILTYLPLFEDILNNLNMSWNELKILQMIWRSLVWIMDMLYWEWLKDRGIPIFVVFVEGPILEF